MSLERPNPFNYIWAEKGEKWELPETGATHKDGYADIETGFPKETMISVINGGVPPYGRDHNTILNRITKDLQWTQAGGLPIFNEQLRDRIGKYPKGAILQHYDPANPDKYPWVLWQCVSEGGSKEDPTGLAINSPVEQNGWRRYPVIETKDGALLYYNDNGELAVATPAVSFTRYVSWSHGDDINNKGIHKKKPFKTIDKAISSSPSSGQIIIRILDSDTHYWMSSYDANHLKDNDISNYNLGEIYTDTDAKKEEPPLTLWYSIGIGSRTILIQPYSYDYIKNDDGSEGSDDDDGKQDFWDELLYAAQINMSDAYWGYCADDTTLQSRGIKRPVIKLMWSYNYSNNINNNFVTSHLSWCGVDGIQGFFSVEFYGCRFETHLKDELNKCAFGFGAGWARPGGNYIFNGCIFNEFSYNSDPQSTAIKYFFGGTEVTSSSVSFRRANQFNDSIVNQGPLMVLVNGPVNIFTTEDKNKNINNTNFTFIENNAVDFMSKGSTYFGFTFTDKKGRKSGSLKKLEFPSLHYAFLTTSYDINENI